MTGYGIRLRTSRVQNMGQSIEFLCRPILFLQAKAQKWQAKSLDLARPIFVDGPSELQEAGEKLFNLAGGEGAVMGYPL